MVTGRMCQICGKWFLPNKYRPNQKICSSLECQYQRQLNNMAMWRKENPQYFKYKEESDESWKEACKERAKKWRESHKEYLKLYREEHKDHYRDYMRKYMREYRRRKNGQDMGTADQGPAA